MHWNLGIDFDHTMLMPSYYAEATDPPIILRFNYTENRELYDMKKMIGG